MSITGLTNPREKLYQKSVPRRDGSGELDVFEAARYFSGATEISGHSGATFAQKIAREDKQAWKGGEVSFENMPIRNSVPSQILKEKKHKQPSSPGGKLASFLNSLFNQTPLKKKKSKSTTPSKKDEDESPGGRRKRRSSISHFRGTSTGDAKSMYSSLTSGFRTPPLYSHNPEISKISKDLIRSINSEEKVVSLSRNSNGLVKSTVLQNEFYDAKKSSDYYGLDEKFRLSNGFSDKYKNYRNGFFEKGQDLKTLEEFKKFNNGVDDGADSDSSSDLFELQNYDSDHYSSGLPVYETTHLEIIRRGAPISNGPV